MLCLVALGVGGVKLVETSVFALPLESLGLPRAVAESLVPRAMPETIELVAAPAPRRARQESTSAGPARPAEQTRPVDRTTSPPAAEAGGSSAAAPTTAPIAASPLTIVDATHPAPAVAGTPPDRALWTRAADQGAAVGQKSKDAGLATARAFTRFGHRVADAF
jgi:hypothetical protein